MNKILQKTFFIASVLVITFIIFHFITFEKKSGSNNRSPSEVVKEYFEKASLKDFKAIELITVYDPNTIESDADRLTENTAFNDANIRRVNPKYQSDIKETKPEDVYFEWIRKDFPLMIYNSRLQITKINNEFIEENSAKVEVSIGNQTNIKEMNWTILLHKTNQEWSIYSTEGIEIDYKSESK